MSKTNGKGNGKPKDSGKRHKGKPTDTLTVIKKKFLDGLREFGTVRHASAVADISRTTAYEYRKQDAQFKSDWKDALEDTREELEKSMYQRAMDGDTTAGIFMLKAMAPEVYRERIDVNQKHSGDLELRVAGYSPQEARDAVMERLQGLLPGVN